MACLGAYTARHRHICWALNCEAPMEWPKEMSSFPGCQAIMVPPEEVRLTLRASHYSPGRRVSNDADKFEPKKLGMVTRGDGSRASDDLHNRLYCPSRPMSTFTSSFAYSGNKERQWAMDVRGPRQWMLREECAVHDFDDEAAVFLEELPQAQAMDYIARSEPVAPLCALYESFLKCLQGDNEQECRNMPDDGTTDPLPPPCRRSPVPEVPATRAMRHL